MLESLRAELKALTEWDRETQLLPTQTEREAVIIRQVRRHEIMQKLARDRRQELAMEQEQEQLIAALEMRATVFPLESVHLLAISTFFQ
jgi:hypothetical protein